MHCLQIDEFVVEAVRLKQLKKIRIGHDGANAGAGWFLDKVSAHNGDKQGNFIQAVNKTKTLNCHHHSYKVVIIYCDNLQVHQVLSFPVYNAHFSTCKLL